MGLGLKSVVIPPKRINPVRADALQRKGLTWKTVAEIISSDVNRYPPFSAAAVQKAVIRHRSRKSP